MYQCTYIRLLTEKAIMIPPEISREGQGGGKEVKKRQFRAEGGIQSKSFIPETPLKMTINGGSDQVKSKIGCHLED